MASPAPSETAAPTSVASAHQPARDGPSPSPSTEHPNAMHDRKALDPLHQHQGQDEDGRPDTFETSQGGNEDDSEDEPVRGSVDLDDLPIELIGLTDNFVESLTSRVHKTPPTIDNVSQLFQDFYQTASNHVATHISALALRQSRSISSDSVSRASAASRLRAKAASLGKDKSAAAAKPDLEHQMITPGELADKKKARRALQEKRAMLEEAVERRLCEGLYNRIYRHRSTQDEAQDDKLRSKTAALALVDIGPADLGIDLGDDDPNAPAARVQRTSEIKQWLEQARNHLVLMNEKRYPLGKLNHLKAAHKSIVDTLAHFHPSASADEIMPMLIYTLITLSPENLNVISDVRFIERFRWEHKLTGEAAYCLTNLEAAISFLDTVDLSTLRADEHPQGPPKEGVPGGLKTETFPPAFPAGSSPPGGVLAETNTNTASAGKPYPSPSATSGLRAAVQARNRRISELVNTPAQALGAASDAVFTTADQSLKNITNSLGDSYNFLVGKLRETQGAPTNTGQALVVPRTLDDARKLVSTPPPGEDGSVIIVEEHDPSARSASSDDKLLNLMTGRKSTVRDHSADSQQSSGTSKRIGLGEGSKDRRAVTPPSSGSNTNPLENAVRNFGNSFNPMARLSSMNVMRGFGRTATSPAAMGPSKDAVAKPVDGGDLSAAFPDIAPALPPKETPKIKPPNKRFMEMQNPGDLRLSEVLELLRDYRRLAGALKERGAFEGQS